MSSGAFLADLLRAEKTPAGSSLDAIFEERPCTLDEFVTGRKYLNNPPLSGIQYEAVRHLEQILYPETYVLMEAEWGEYWKPVRFINFAYLQWGKGSGKDHICRVAAARVAYLLLCLKSPQAYFGMPAQDEIQTLNVAVSATQAHRAFFKPLRTMLVESPWFNNKFASHEPPGEQATSIRFKKQVELVSGHSAAESMEGLNLILAIADEISGFRTRDEAERYGGRGAREPANTSEAILGMLRTSAVTRFPQNFKLVAISYPRFKGDAIQQLCLRGREDNEELAEKSRYFVSGPHATWEVNPRLSAFPLVDHPNSPIPVPDLPTFTEEFTKDPVASRAKYLCQPELSANRFFRNEQLIYAAFGEPMPPPIRFEYYWGVERSGEDDEKWFAREESGQSFATPDAWQVKFHFEPDFVPIQGAIYAVHGDIAINGDSAGVALCHVRNFVTGEHVHQWHPHDDVREMSERRPVVKVDYVGSFESDVAALPMARDVQIRWYRKLIYTLISRGFNIRFVSFDSFQSTDTIQLLEAQGIESKRVSMDLNVAPWETLRDVLYDGRLEAYWNARVVDELLSLTRLGNGKLDHPPGGSKDLADALAGAVSGAIYLGGSEGESPVRVGMEIESLIMDGGKWVAESGMDNELYGDFDFSSLGQLEI